MQSAQLPIHVNHVGLLTLQAQIVDEIVTLIRNGKLAPGAPIPSSRELSHQLGVSRNTVSEAYDQLISEGYVYTERAVGTFVARTLPDHSLSVSTHGAPLRTGSLYRSVNLPLPYTGRGLPGLYRAHEPPLYCDFSVGRSDPHVFPQSVWRKLTLECLADAPQHLSEYGDPAGLRELRQLITNYLSGARGMVVSTEQVLIVAGFQQGINLVAHLFVGTHTPIVMEAPCYRGASFLFESYGGRVLPVPVDDLGIDVGRLPEQRVKLVYVTPSHQFPTGVTMPLDRRLALLDWAAKAGAYILEVDYDADFRYEGSPLPSLQALDRNGCVIYLNSFSRSIGPGIRLGYMVVPPSLIRPATTIKALIDNGLPWLEQATLARFIRNGGFIAHLKRLRHTFQGRRDALVSALHRHFGDVRVSGGQGGTHMLWQLPTSLPAAIELQSKALECGVGVYPLTDSPAYFHEHLKDHERFVLMGYTHLSEDHIRKGVARIAAALGSVGVRP